MCRIKKNRRIIKNIFFIISGWFGLSTRRRRRFFDGGEWLFGDVGLLSTVVDWNRAYVVIEGYRGGIWGVIFESSFLLFFG